MVIARCRTDLLSAVGARRRMWLSVSRRRLALGVGVMSRVSVFPRVAVGFATVLGLGALVAGHAATAASPHGTATGTVTCRGVAGAINFSPPLTQSAALKETATFADVTETGCTDSSGSVSATGVKVAINLHESGNGSCAAFLTATGDDAVTVTTDWSGGISPTTVTFQPGSVAIAHSDLDLYMTGGKATGSFKSFGGSRAASFDVTLAPASRTQLVDCMLFGSTDVSSLTITAGSSSA